MWATELKNMQDLCEALKDFVRYLHKQATDMAKRRASLEPARCALLMVNRCELQSVVN